MGKQKEKPEKPQPTMYVLSEENLNTIVAIAAEEGIRSYKAEQDREQKERQSRHENNARTLIYNYRRFKSMCNRSVYTIEDSEDADLQELMEIMQGRIRAKNYETISIKDKVVRTRLIMDHVDAMLDVFKKQCEKAADPEESRRYRVIEGLYLAPEPKTVREIAEEESITTSTVYRDCNKAFRRLAILFFGIDGARF